MGLRLFNAIGGSVKKGMNWIKRLKLGKDGRIQAADERREGDCLMSEIEPMEVSVLLGLVSGIFFQSCFAGTGMD